MGDKKEENKTSSTEASTKEAKKEPVKEIKKEELNAENYMPKEPKPRLKMSRYTMMLIPDSTDSLKTYEFTIDKIARYIVLFVAAIVLIVMLITSFAVKNYRLRNDYSLKTQIENLQEDNESLTEKNNELSKLLSENDSQISELKSRINELELESASEYIPSIIPYKGSAVALTNTVTEGAVSYACLEGLRILATAKGKVVNIEETDIGTEITVDHDNGYKTRYITPGKIEVKVDDMVNKGDCISEITEDDGIFSYIVFLNNKPTDPKELMK